MPQRHPALLAPPTTRLIHEQRTRTDTEPPEPDHHPRRPTLQVDIYRLEEVDWLMEVVNEEGSSHVWDDRFATDKAAQDAVHEAIDEEGVAAFLD